MRVLALVKERYLSLNRTKSCQGELSSNNTKSCQDEVFEFRSNKLPRVTVIILNLCLD